MRRRVQQILCGALIAGTVLASQPLPVFAETDTETGSDVSETDVKENSDYEIKVNEDNPDTATIVKYKGNEKELKIPEYIDGKKITEIDYGAFEDCKSITSLELPDSVEKLGLIFGRFSNDSLTNVKLPGKDLVYAEEYSINWSDDCGPEYIRPFSYCKNLRRVEIADGATRVDLRMFEPGCSALQEIVIPKTVTEIIQSKVTPYHLTVHGYKGSYAEEWAKKNNCGEFIDLEESAKQNSDYEIEVDKTDPYKAVLVSYHGNENELIIPEYIEGRKITEVASGAFKDCKNITSLEIPATVEILNSCLFGTDGSSALVNVKLPEKNIALPEPSEVADSEGHSMKTGPFAFCENLKKIEIPEGTTIIPAYFFGGCRGLQEITLPTLLKEISMDAFADCCNLKKVVIPGVSTTVKSSKSYIPGSLKLYAYGESEAEKWAKQTDPACFVDLADVEKKVEPTWEIKENEDDKSTATIVKYEGNDVVLEIPEYIDGKKITGLELGAFDGTSIQLVKIPASVKNVEYPEDYDERFSFEQWDDGPFSSCPYLTKAVIEEGAATVPDRLFTDCYQLKTVEIPDTVTEIEGEAFSGCRSLENVKLPANLLCLGRFSFSGCDSLTEIKIPRSLNEVIADEWMASCCGSEYVGPFAGSKGLKKAELEDGIKEVPDSLFAGCEGLETVLIPASVTSIGKEAFGEYYYRCEPTIQGYADTFAEKWAKENGFKFTSLGEKPVTATPTPSVANEYSAKISGRNLSLTGKIGASAYVQVSDELLKDENAYVTITVGDKEEKTLLKNLTCIETKGRKVLLLSTNVKANETNEGVCIRLYAGDGRLIPITDDNSKKADVYTYTVADTARVYMNAKSSSKKLKKLAEAILNYGIYTQKQQNYKADDLTATDDLADINKSVLKNYAIKKSGKVNGVSYAGVNMELKEDTGITVYFKATVDPSKLTFTVDGKKLDVETKDLEKGKLVSVKINGISAQKLSTSKMVVVSDGESELKVKLSALSWCEIVLNGKNYSKETVDLAKMIYRYSSAADEYFGK